MQSRGQGGRAAPLTPCVSIPDGDGALYRAGAPAQRYDGFHVCGCVGKFLHLAELTRGGAFFFRRATVRSVIEAPLITREVLPETYFLLVIMAADAQAGPFSPRLCKGRRRRQGC
jgi:hypothetical protein